MSGVAPKDQAEVGLECQLRPFNQARVLFGGQVFVVVLREPPWAGTAPDPHFRCVRGVCSVLRLADRVQLKTRSSKICPRVGRAQRSESGAVSRASGPGLGAGADVWGRELIPPNSEGWALDPRSELQRCFPDPEASSDSAPAFPWDPGLAHGVGASGSTTFLKICVARQQTYWLF